MQVNGKQGTAGQGWPWPCQSRVSTAVTGPRRRQCHTHRAPLSLIDTGPPRLWRTPDIADLMIW